MSLVQCEEFFHRSDSQTRLIFSPAPCPNCTFQVCRRYTILKKSLSSFAKGNCLKGSRPILSFDATFDTQPHLLVIKELLTHIFSVPKASRKTKPFVDHVMGFTLVDGKIWCRCFQIGETEVLKPDANTAINGNTSDNEASAVTESRREGTRVTLTEIGPRFVLTPIVILESSFGGPVIYENKEFVSPNQVRAELRLRRAGKYARRSEQAIERGAKRGSLGLKTGAGRRKREGDELDDRTLFS
jgi:ribosome biogenesis protein BRX1